MLQFASDSLPTIHSFFKKTCMKFITIITVISCLSGNMYGFCKKHEFHVVRGIRPKISAVIVRGNYKISLKRTFLQISIWLSAFMNLNWHPQHSANSAWLDSFHRRSLNGCVYTAKLTGAGFCASIISSAWCGFGKKPILAVLCHLMSWPEK